MPSAPLSEARPCESPQTTTPQSRLLFATDKSSAYRTHLFLGKPDTPENRAAFVSTIPLGRGSTPKDVANACCYLASDEAEFVTGINLEVDGGRTV
jgi:NAD(P)-dependent dehydrogenase (short-subunit alcohol dehydrogenase family)